jgi:hypothetical protein
MGQVPGRNRSTQKSDDFVVLDRLEPPIPFSYSVEGIGNHENDHVVGLSPQSGIRFWRADPEREHDARHMQRAKSPHRDPHGAPRSDSIVDQDDGPVGEVNPRSTFAVLPYSPVQLSPLSFNGGFEGGRGIPRLEYPEVIQNLDPTFRDSAEAVLRVARRSNLSNDKNVQRGVERAGHLRGHDHAPTGNPQNYRVLVSVLEQSFAQLATGLLTIFQNLQTVQLRFHRPLPVTSEASGGGNLAVKSTSPSLPYPTIPFAQAF